MEMATVLGVYAVIFGIYGIILLLGLVGYVLNALALHKIASRRQISNPWLAWIPYGTVWIIGSIADEYDGRNGIKRKWRVVLLTLSLISVVGIVVGYAVMIVWMFSIGLFDYGYGEPEIGAMIGGLLFVYVILIVAVLLASALGFCQVICIYKIFESTVPEKSMKYLLLYLLVPLAGNICLFKCRNQGYSNEAVPYQADATEIPSEENNQW